MNRLFDTASAVTLRALASLLFVCFALLLGLIYAIVTPFVYVSGLIRRTLWSESVSFEQDNVDEYYLSGSSLGGINITHDMLDADLVSFTCGNRAFIRVKVHFK